MEAMTLGQAVGIGLFQCLALIPGTSRAGATIAGALILGFTRTAAAEFSFLVGLPILYGACGLKVIRKIDEVTGPMHILIFSSAENFRRVFLLSSLITDSVLLFFLIILMNC